MEQPPLTQNLWERYGFTDNPYDTKALSISDAAVLSVKEAYIERGSPSIASQTLTNFLRSPGGGRIVVEGDPGVGKTTFVNHHRHRWEVSAQQKLLSPATEISVRENWSERDFLLNLLSSLSARLRLDLGEKAFAKDKLLREINAITGINVEGTGGLTGNLTLFGFGGGLGRTKGTSVKVGEITNDQLRAYLRQLVERVRSRKFAGVIFHLDNLDLLRRPGPERLSDFFDAVRDVLQEPHVYYIFVGYKGLYQEAIVPRDRVRSIFFDTPVVVEPLSAEQVKEAMEKRYALLAAPRKNWIRPVEDEVIVYLYRTFAGKIRYVMNAVTSLISNLPDSYARPLSLAEAKAVLRQIVQREVKHTLTDAAAEIFLAAVNLDRFTNASLAEQTKKTKQLIQKYLSHWLTLGLVSHGEKTGRNQFYLVEPRFSVLKD